MAKILVVDDEMGIRELLSEILDDEGHDVTCAENAAAARVAYLANTFDVVLLDIWMPDTDGVSLLKEWSLAKVLDCPVIMMSGHATIDTAVEATRLGAFNFLEKPISMSRLLSTVQAALNRRAKQLAGVTVVLPVVLSEPAAKEVVSKDIAVIASPAHAAHLEHAALSDHTAHLQHAAHLAILQAANKASHAVELDQPLREARDAFERVYFLHLCEQAHWSMSIVAEKSGLERTHLYRKLKQLEIEIKRERKQ